MDTFIFDLDGTLADTLESIVYSVQATLQEMGLSKITDEQCRQFVGNGARYLMEHALEAAGDPDGARLDEGMHRYGRIFDENCTYHVTPYEGIREVLAELKRSGKKLAVLSNKPHAQTVKVIHSVFGETLFDCVQGQQDGIKRKPAPDGICAILEELAVTADGCAYVGDSEVDIETARNAGIQEIMVGWGFRTREELIEAGAGRILDEAQELLEFAR